MKEICDFMLHQRAVETLTTISVTLIDQIMAVEGGEWQVEPILRPQLGVSREGYYTHFFMYQVK